MIMRHIFINEKIIFGAVLLNIIILFLLSFPSLSAHFETFEYIDHLLTLYFLLEAIVKIYLVGWKSYIRSGWNRVDFLAVVLTTPSLILYFFQIPLFLPVRVLRSLRVIKFLRFLKFVPRFDTIILGLSRAVKASLLVLVAFFLYNTLISIFNCYLFKHIAPEYFGNGLRSFYTTFRMFTLDGWNEIPETIMAANETSSSFTFFSVFYFVFIVISGGIFGLSIVNAIFVDGMVRGNNCQLETKVSDLEHKVDRLIELLNKFNTQLSNTQKD